MRVLSVNVGQPRKIDAGGRTVMTSIFKSSVQGRVKLRGFNLEGDRQADLRVHGGPDKAIYLYPGEHYAYWKEQLPGVDLPFGSFGENLTTEGISEETVHIGDRFRIGSAVLQVAQPRMPCSKLALRMGRADMVKLFWKSGLSGMYLSVVEEGELAAGDPIELVATGSDCVRVADVVRLYKRETSDSDLIERVLQAPLRGSWKAEIQTRSTEISG